jgi:multicomponent Na+:H+ antiporter subunit D
MFMIGAALMLPTGLAGASIYVMGHGLVKGALFICAGIILNRAESVDEVELHARPLGFGVTAAVYTAAAFGLAGLPPFATALGKSLIDRSAESAGAHWVGPVLVLCSGLTAGAVMRAGGRIFLGWGVIGEEEETSPTQHDEPESHSGRGIPFVMLTPAVAMTALALVVGLAPRLGYHAAVACARFQDGASYAAAMLNGRAPAPAPASFPGTGEDWPSGLISAGAAVILAALGLFAERLPRFVAVPARMAGLAIRAAHTRRIGDYVTWLLLGVTAFELLLALGVK